MEEINKDALPNGTQLQSGKFIIDRLFSDKGGFSLIYEGRYIQQIKEDFFGKPKVIETKEEKVIIKELYYKDKAERRTGETALTWRPKDSTDKDLIEKLKAKTKSEGEKLLHLAYQTPYIITIIAAFEENNTVYLVTKKIEGAVDFKTIIKGVKSKHIAPEPLSIASCLRYFGHICEALQVVHNNNIIHLDIKPDNILRDIKDNAILIDFGISVSLQGGGKIITLLEGAQTPYYSPPEQGSREMENIGFYSDIYALGATMYYFFTHGHLPPEHGNRSSGAEVLVPPSHYNSEVSEYLDSIVEKCLSINFRKRYQTIEELQKALNGEEHYTQLVAVAETALKNKEYEKGIEAIIATEQFIPLTPNLHQLKKKLQQGREQHQEEEVRKQQLLNAQELIRQKKYQQAIDILQLLPESSLIKDKIVFCETKLKEENITSLLQDAIFYEDNSQYHKALEVYLEAKKLKQNDKQINAKIEEIQTIIATQNDANKIAQVIAAYKNKQITFEDLQVQIDNFLQKYPQNNTIAAEWKTIQQQKAEEDKEIQNKTYLDKANISLSDEEALSWLQKISQNSKYYDKASKQIARINKNIEEKAHKELLSKADMANSYEEALSYLEKIPTSSKYYHEAQSEIVRIKEAIAELQQEHEYKEYLDKGKKSTSDEEALKWLRKIPETSKYYNKAKQEITKREQHIQEQTYNNLLAKAKKETDNTKKLELLQQIPNTFSDFDSVKAEINSIKINIKNEETQIIEEAKTKIAEDKTEIAKTLLLNIKESSEVYQEAQTILKTIDTDTPVDAPSKSKKIGIWIGILLVLMVIGVVVWKIMPNEAAEFKKAQQEDTIAAYEHFIQAYPNSTYTLEAKTLLQKKYNEKNKKEFDKYFETSLEMLQKANLCLQQHKFEEFVTYAQKTKSTLSTALNNYDIDDTKVQAKIQVYNNMLIRYKQQIDKDKNLDPSNVAVYNKRLDKIKELKIKQ